MFICLGVGRCVANDKSRFSLADWYERFVCKLVHGGECNNDGMKGICTNVYDPL